MSLCKVVSGVVGFALIYGIVEQVRKKAAQTATPAATEAATEERPPVQVEQLARVETERDDLARDNRGLQARNRELLESVIMLQTFARTLSDELVSCREQLDPALSAFNQLLTDANTLTLPYDPKWFDYDEKLDESGVCVLAGCSAILGLKEGQVATSTDEEGEPILFIYYGPSKQTAYRIEPRSVLDLSDGTYASKIIPPAQIAAKVVGYVPMGLGEDLDPIQILLDTAAAT